MNKEELFVEKSQFNEEEQIKALFEKPIHWEDQDWRSRLNLPV